MRELIEEVDGQITRPATPGAFEPRLVALALDALSARALVWAASLGAGAMWGVTLAHPAVLTLIASVGYCGTVLLPILIRDARGG